MNFCFSSGLITLNREKTRLQFNTGGGTGDGTFISPGFLSAPFVTTRAQLAGVEVLELGETVFINYVAPSVLLAPLALTRAQVGGVEVLEDA
jgi:hypothetical protein